MNANDQDKLRDRRWKVSAPHLDPSSPAGWMPWGKRHARVDSEPRTACGQLAVSWRVFWSMPFDAGDASACQDCADATKEEVLANFRQTVA